MDNIHVSLDVHIGEQPPQSSKQLYRVLHDVELPTGLRACAPCPEVFPLDAMRSPFGKLWQLLAFTMNQGMTGGHFRSLYGDTTAFTNGTGFPLKTGQNIHADYINLENLTYPDPAFDKTRICGGATITGVESSGYLIVDHLDSTGTPPTVAELMKHPTLFFHATICTRTGIDRFPQMGGDPVLVPFLGRTGAKIPLSALQKVPGIADPYYIGYRPSPYV